MRLDYKLMVIGSSDIIGYSGDHNKTITFHSTMNDVLHRLMEGGVVLNIKQALRKKSGARLLADGPMVKVDLLEGRPWPDMVDINTFVSIWEKIGAKVGKRVGDEIHWRGGKVEKVPHSTRYEFIDPLEVEEMFPIEEETPVYESVDGGNEED